MKFAENELDETGTVDTDGLTDDESVETSSLKQGLAARERELLEACGVNDELLQVHETAPGSKQEGVTRLLYENLNGINSRLSQNDKLDKLREINNDLEADIVCYNYRY
jgi:hypothetical protein